MKILALLLLAVALTGCSTVFPKQQVVDPVTGATNTVHVLKPEIEKIVRETGSVFGPYGDLAVSALLGGTGLGLVIYNRRKDNER